MLIESFESIKPEDDPYEHKKKSIRRYVQLLGAWIYLYYPQSSLSNYIIKFLKKYKFREKFKDEVISFSLSEMVQLGYPEGDFIYGEWFLYHSEHWQNFTAEINKTLNNPKNYKEYSNIVNC